MEFTTLGCAFTVMEVVVVVVTGVVFLSAVVHGNPVAKPLQLWRQQWRQWMCWAGALAASLASTSAMRASSAGSIVLVYCV